MMDDEWRKEVEAGFCLYLVLIGLDSLMEPEGFKLDFVCHATVFHPTTLKESLLKLH
jgi:hypothetical protein